MNNHIVTVTVPRFGWMLIKEYLKALAGGANVSIPPEPKSTRYKPASDKVKLVFTYNHYQSSQANSFTRSLTKIFNSSFLSFETSEEPMFSDEWAEFEYRLQNHDWHYSFSDDHGVWSAGQRAWEEIKQLKDKLMLTDAARCEKLWKNFSKS